MDEQTDERREEQTDKRREEQTDGRRDERFFLDIPLYLHALCIITLFLELSDCDRAGN
jgi:hypothetical protein